MRNDKQVTETYTETLIENKTLPMLVSNRILFYKKPICNQKGHKEMHQYGCILGGLEQVINKPRANPGYVAQHCQFMRLIKILASTEKPLVNALMQQP